MVNSCKSDISPITTNPINNYEKYCFFDIDQAEKHAKTQKW